MIRADAIKRSVIQCSLPSALEAMGERWSFMILRGAFNGLSHFEQFQATLGIARNILANRLTRLVEHGILARAAVPGDRRKVKYQLTEKGRALLPTLIALRQWGERWEDGVPNNPVLVDARDGLPVADMAVRAADGRPLAHHELRWVDRSELEAATPHCLFCGAPIVSGTGQTCTRDCEVNQALRAQKARVQD